MHQEKVVPPQVYRCLRRLLDTGVVKHIESLRSFCISDEGGDAIVFCRSCGTHKTIPSGIPAGDLDAAHREKGFEDGRVIVEIEATCASCRASGDAKFSNY